MWSPLTSPRILLPSVTTMTCTATYRNRQRLMCRDDESRSSSQKSKVFNGESSKSNAYICVASYAPYWRSDRDRCGRSTCLLICESCNRLWRENFARADAEMEESNWPLDNNKRNVFCPIFGNICMSSGYFDDDARTYMWPPPVQNCRNYYAPAHYFLQQLFDRDRLTSLAH